MKYRRDGTDYISITGIEIDSDKDFKTKKIVNLGGIGINKANPAEALDIIGNIALSGTVDGQDVSQAVQNLQNMIKQVHPTLQVLAAMDEATYSNIEKSGTDYKLLSGSDLSEWVETDPNSRLTISPNKVDFNQLQDIDPNTNIYIAKTYAGDFNLNFEYFCSEYGNEGNPGIGFMVATDGTIRYTLAGATRMGFVPFNSTTAYLKKYTGATETHTTTAITIALSTVYYCTLSRVGTTVTLSVYTDSARTVHATGSPVSFTETTTTSYSGVGAAWNSGSGGNFGAVGYYQNITPLGTAATAGNLSSAAISSDSAVLSFFKHLKNNISNGSSTHATPVQAEIYGNADSYAAALHTTKFTITPADPRIILKRDAIDTITASSANQTVWNMTVAGGLPAVSGANHGTILATQIGVAAILVVEKSILGDFTDAVVLVEGTDYVVDYSTRTATKITLTSGAGIVNAQSKLRLTWIADVMKIDGATNNTALKCKLYLNRTAVGEATPSIQLIELGSGKYVELLYGT